MRHLRACPKKTIIVLIILVLFGSAVIAQAGSATINSSVDVTDPLADPYPADCLGYQFANPGNIYVDFTSFWVDTAGAYTITVSSPPAWLGAIVTLHSPFNATNPQIGCVAADLDDGTLQGTFTAALAANTEHVLLVSSNLWGGTGAYTATITGPGEVCVGAPCAGGCDTQINIPASAVGAAFVADAPVYWAPDAGSAIDVTITAGNTARAIGLDASGAYYQILWECQFVWVPANTLGPNYDAVWNGAPLPTDVVE